MLVQPLLSIGTMMVFTNFVNIEFNAIAAMSIPWSMPYPITAFIAGGLPLLVIMLIIIALTALLYLPFFKIADKKAIKEELQLANEVQSA